MPKGGTDVKIEAYEKRLYDMVMQDTSPEKDWEGRKKEADTIMSRLLGEQWNSIGDKKDPEYIDKLDTAGDKLGLGRAPESPGPLDNPKQHEESGLSGFLCTLRDALNKLMPSKKQD
jgi:hypothetical protein